MTTPDRPASDPSPAPQVRAPGAPERGTINEDFRGTVARDADRQRAEADAARRPKDLPFNAEHHDPDDPDTDHMRALPGLRTGLPTLKRTGPGDEAPRGTSPAHDDSAALQSAGAPILRERAPDGTPRVDASGNALVEGTAAVMQAKVAGGGGAGGGTGHTVGPEDADRTADPVAAASLRSITTQRPENAEPVVWGNAPNRHKAAGSASGTNYSNTVGAGTESSLGQVGPGSSIQSAQGATEGTTVASGTWTRADPEDEARADDTPMRDPRPASQRATSEATPSVRPGKGRPKTD